MLNSTSNYLLVLFINFSVEAKILPIMAKLILKSEGVKTVKRNQNDCKIVRCKMIAALAAHNRVLNRQNPQILKKGCYLKR